MILNTINPKLIGPRRLIEFTYNGYHSVLGVSIGIAKEVGKLIVLTADLESLRNSRYGIAYEEEKYSTDSKYLEIEFKNISKILDFEIKSDFQLQSSERLKAKS